MTSNEHGYVKDGAQDARLLPCLEHVDVQPVVRKSLLHATCTRITKSLRTQCYKLPCPDAVFVLRCSRPAEQSGQLHP